MLNIIFLIDKMYLPLHDYLQMYYFRFCSQGVVAHLLQVLHCKNVSYPNNLTLLGHPWKDSMQNDIDDGNHFDCDTISCLTKYKIPIDIMIFSNQILTRQYR